MKPIEIRITVEQIEKTARIANSPIQFVELVAKGFSNFGEVQTAQNLKHATSSFADAFISRMAEVDPNNLTTYKALSQQWVQRQMKLIPAKRTKKKRQHHQRYMELHGTQGHIPTYEGGAFSPR